MNKRDWAIVMATATVNALLFGFVLMVMPARGVTTYERDIYDERADDAGTDTAVTVPWEEIFAS